MLLVSVHKAYYLLLLANPGLCFVRICLFKQDFPGKV